MKTENYFETPEFKYTKVGLESELTRLCKQAGLTQYLEHDYLNQGYSLSMPYPMLELMIEFESIVDEIYGQASHTAPSYVVNELKELDEFVKGIATREAAKFVKRTDIIKTEDDFYIADAVLEYVKRTGEPVFADENEMSNFDLLIYEYEDKERENEV